MPLLEARDAGLYCPAGDFYIDPCVPVDRAVITHAHSDHAVAGSRSYLTASPGVALLLARVGSDAAIQSLPYGEPLRIGDVTLSLHPAGHILGSAQVRLERAGEVWVVSGDYKLAPDPTCPPFEPQRCHTFVTESTFALPIFRWPEASEAIAGIEAWWRANQEAGRASLLFAYPMGKMQRVLASLDASIGPIVCHGAVERYSRIYGEEGIAIPASAPVWKDYSRALVAGPPSAHNSPWTRRFGAASTALVSGWMRIRGTRRRRSLDRGFVLSDHADWPALLRAIDESGAETVWVTHGYRAPLVRWLHEHGRQAVAIETRLSEAEVEPQEEATA
ncbi:MAG TPA: ligase-associated DNA damage response exonuclease [Candidatus Sulfopaludibacter sp.]|nr:ligase-associated DNA damage response exonuclease [Candidatus Sulfopaludibacter sp.]